MHEAGYVDYLEHLVTLPILGIIICPLLNYYILSIFHNLGSPLSYHTLIFDLISSRNMYLYNGYIYTYIPFYLSYGRDKRLQVKLYDKRDYFNSNIVNFPFLSSNIPQSPAYGMFHNLYVTLVHPLLTMIFWLEVAS